MDNHAKNQSDADALTAMVERIPEQRALVEDAYASDANFRTLCRDYLVCRDVVARATGQREGRLADYTRLEVELVEEARLWLLVLEAKRRKRDS